MMWLLIGAGGALGAMARHAVNSLVQSRYGADPFPAGVLVVNVLGCLAAGLLAGVIATGRTPVPLEVRMFVLVGLLGGFTTFSAFGLDTFTLLHTGHYATAAWNVLSQVALTLAAVWVGFALAQL